MSKNLDFAPQKLSLWSSLSIYSENLVFAATNLVSGPKTKFMDAQA
jgi:hypothetical protein